VEEVLLAGIKTVKALWALRDWGDRMSVSLKEIAVLLSNSLKYEASAALFCAALTEAVCMMKENKMIMDVIFR